MWLWTCHQTIEQKKNLVKWEVEVYHTAGLVICLGGVSFPEATIILHFSRSFIRLQNLIYFLLIYYVSSTWNCSSVTWQVHRVQFSLCLFGQAEAQWLLLGQLCSVGTFNTQCNYLTYVTSVQLEVLICTFFFSHKFILALKRIRLFKRHICKKNFSK